MNIENELESFNLNYYKIIGGSKPESNQERKSEEKSKLKLVTPQTLVTLMKNPDNISKVAIVDVLDSKLKLHTNDIIEDILFNGKDFLEDFENKYELIIFYCANYTCSASKSFKKKFLDQFPNQKADIMLYEGGIYEWGYLALQHPNVFKIKEGEKILDKNEIAKEIINNNHWSEFRKQEYYEIPGLLLEEFNQPSGIYKENFGDFEILKTNKNSGNLLEGKVCVVTGGTSGLGLESVKTMLRQGAKHVTLTFYNNEERAEEVKNNLTNEFGSNRFHVLKADARTLEGNKLTFSKEQRTYVNDDLKGIDCVNLNAGIFGPASFNLKHVHNLSEEDWDSVMNTNLKGVFFGIQEFSKQVQENEIKDATAVCIKSIYGSSGSLFSNIAYQTSKHGVMGLVRQSAITLGRENVKLGIKYPIRINAISPTFTNTNLTKPMFSENSIKDVIESANPMKGLALKEDVANAVIYLLSSLSGSITGSDLPVDRGVLAESIPSAKDVLNLNEEDIELLSCCGATPEDEKI